MLTSYELIKDRIKSAYLTNEKKYLYQQMVYALGQESAYLNNWRGLDGDDPWGDHIRYFPEIEILDIIKGHSRKPLNAQYIMQSRVMGEMPEPMFPQLDPFTAEVRKQWCLNRDKQNYGLGEWFPHLTAAFNYADAFGYAAVQVGNKVDPWDKKSSVFVQHVSPLNILWDPLKNHPSESSWVAVIHYMTPDDVAEMYGGRKDRDQLIDAQSKPTWQSIEGQKWDVCRVIEYYDRAVGKGEPTYAVIVGNVDGKNAFVAREHNKRESLPLAFMVNFVAPGMRRPVGRVHLQLQSSKMINLLENYMFRTLSMQPDVDLIYQEAINDEDWQKLMSGAPVTHLRLKKGVDKNPWFRIEKKQIPRQVMEMLDYYVRQYTEDSGLSELDRGVSPDKVRSASELNLIQSNSQLNQGWIPREAMRFMVRFYHRTVEVGYAEDDKPIVIDYKGKNLPLNTDMEGYPNLRVDKFLEEFSMILIDQMALSSADDQVKRQRRLTYLQMLPAMGVPVDQQWYAEEVLVAGGQDDPQIALGMQSATAPMAGVNPAALQVAGSGQGPTVPMGM